MIHDIDLDLDLDPSDICTAQQKGVAVINGRAKVYTKPRVIQSNERIRDAMISAMRTAGIRFMHKQIKIKRGNHARFILKRVVESRIEKRVPVIITILYQFPFQANASKKRLDQKWEPMIERPDVDNLTKSVFDCLTELELIADDSQIVIARLGKIRSIHPGIRIKISMVKPWLDDFFPG